MSRLIARILLAIFVIPLASIVYLVGWRLFQAWAWRHYYYGSPWATEEWSFIVAGALGWIFVGAWWFLLWRKSVRWTGGRIVFTLAATGLSLLMAAAVYSLVKNIVDSNFGSFIGSTCAPMLWLVGTIFAWRETRAERAERVSRSTRGAVACPTCGYNLTGLREARCPECGSQFTLDQLLAVQRDAGAAGPSELDG
jgi:hypothetical protein